MADLLFVSFDFKARCSQLSCNSLICGLAGVKRKVHLYNDSAVPNAIESVITSSIGGNLLKSPNHGIGALGIRQEKCR